MSLQPSSLGGNRVPHYGSVDLGTPPLNLKSPLSSFDVDPQTSLGVCAISKLSQPAPQREVTLTIDKIRNSLLFAKVDLDIKIKNGQTKSTFSKWVSGHDKKIETAKKTYETIRAQILVMTVNPMVDQKNKEALKFLLSEVERPESLELIIKDKQADHLENLEEIEAQLEDSSLQVHKKTIEHLQNKLLKLEKTFAPFINEANSTAEEITQRQALKNKIYTIIDALKFQAKTHPEFPVFAGLGMVTLFNQAIRSEDNES